MSTLERSAVGFQPPKGAVITDWRPEDPQFWSNAGRRSPPATCGSPCPRCCWRSPSGWSGAVMVAPEQLGFTFSTDQLFCSPRCPALSGATLRIFYCFMVPIFGGRRWTALSTASLLIPCTLDELRGAEPRDALSVRGDLALLCGFGGGNFSSSMSNISFFFPKARQGTALGLNAGLGNLGVSTMQFAVPLASRRRRAVRRVRRRAPGSCSDGTRIWLQNAGLHLGAVHCPDRPGGLVRHARHRRRQVVDPRPGGDLPAQAHLVDVLAVHRHVRLVHRLLGRPSRC